MQRWEDKGNRKYKGSKENDVFVDRQVSVVGNSTIKITIGTIFVKAEEIKVQVKIHIQLFVNHVYEYMFSTVLELY